MLHLDTKPLVPEANTPANPYTGLVSIIIPTYNCAGTIGRSLESLLAQTYSNIEIIVVDDASKDETESVVTRHDAVYIRLDVNSGAAVARNDGAKKAAGAILMFAEADGYYDSDYVEKIIRHMHLPGVAAGINLGRKVWTDRKSALVRFQNDLLKAAADKTWKGERGTGAWAFHAKAFWKVKGYDPDCRIGQDMDLVRRIVRQCGRTVVGGFSTLYHKDPDTLRKYWRRAYRGGYFSGRFQSKWRKKSGALNRMQYVIKYVLMAAAPLYLAGVFSVHWLLALPFTGVMAYLLLEDPTTTLAWTDSLKRGDITTFFAAPALLYFRRLAIGWGRIRSFFAKVPA